MNGRECREGTVQAPSQISVEMVNIPIRRDSWCAVPAVKKNTKTLRVGRLMDVGSGGLSWGRWRKDVRELFKQKLRPLQGWLTENFKRVHVTARTRY